jgi:hypothetical protein
MTCRSGSQILGVLVEHGAKGAHDLADRLVELRLARVS